MSKMIACVTILLWCLLQVRAETIVLAAETTTFEPPGPPRPYAFGYAAGRFPGHIDRTHSEVSDGHGTVQGSYSYVDPRHKIRTVEYIADKNGFHVINPDQSALPKESFAVAAARQRHLEQFAKIAQGGVAALPAETHAVALARQKHLNLFNRIAQEHSLLAQQTKLLEN